MPNAEKSGNLYVKSFFAVSVPAAMEQARRELGADALLLNSRPSPPEARHLGEYEVVFGTLPEGPAAAPPPPPRLSRADELHHRIHEIREMIGRMRPSFALPSGENRVSRALSSMPAWTSNWRSPSNAPCAAG
jgi:hypothetical protein